MRQSVGTMAFARKLVHKTSSSQRDTPWCIAFGPSHFWISRLERALYATRLEYCGTCIAIGGTDRVETGRYPDNVNDALKTLRSISKGINKETHENCKMCIFVGGPTSASIDICCSN